MKLTVNVLVGVALIAGMWPSAAFAQMDAEDSKLNTNLALVLTAPLNPTARFTNFGWGVVAGAGYNFTSHHAFVGEFMWNRLQVSDRALRPIRLALQSPDIDGHANETSMIFFSLEQEPAEKQELVALPGIEPGF